MYNKYLIRLDDLSPFMKKKNFFLIRDLLDNYNIKPIIGIIPNNKDHEIKFEKYNFNFWKLVYELQKNNYFVAQHGYTHEKLSNQSGIMGINNLSEFAGLSLKDQINRIIAGKKILTSKKIKTNAFMFPFHSYDENSLNAIKQSGFKYIIDGYGLKPFLYKNLIHIPFLFSKPIKVPVGIYTICLHTDSMDEKDFDFISRFIEKNHKNIIGMNDLDLNSLSRSNKLIIILYKVAIFLIRFLKSALIPNKNSLR